MKTYEETIKHLAELYLAAVKGRVYQPKTGPHSPYNEISALTYDEQNKWLDNHPFEWPDFHEYDMALYEATQEFDLDWFKLNKDTLDYIHGRLSFD